MKGYSEKELREVVLESFSIAEVLKKLNKVGAGGNYRSFRLAVKKYNIDTSHFLGQGHLKGKTHTWSKKIPLSEVLVENSTYGSTSKLRKRLVKEGLLENKCYCCGITEWMGKQISLELEHKNGDKFDNRIENLTSLCPNCHSQTPTFRGRNKGLNYGDKELNKKTAIKNREIFGKAIETKIIRGRKERILIIKICRDCGKTLSKNCKTFRCVKCDHFSKRKAIRPNVEELSKMIETMSWCAIGRKYGVSDNAVRKWARGYGIKPGAKDSF